MIEGKPHACIALCHRFLKLRDQGEPYTSTPQFGSPLIRIKSMPDTPLSRLPRLSRRYSGSPESSIAGPACFGLSQLSQLSSHISTTEPKRAEDLKENAALRIPSKGPKRSNFIEFYKKSKTQLPLPWSWEPGLSSLSPLSSHISTGKRRLRRLLALVAHLAHFCQTIGHAGGLCDDCPTRQTIRTHPFLQSQPPCLRWQLL